MLARSLVPAERLAEWVCFLGSFWALALMGIAQAAIKNIADEVQRAVLCMSVVGCVVYLGNA